VAQSVDKTSLSLISTAQFFGKGTGKLNANAAGELDFRSQIFIQKKLHLP
jgi:hypothetical protein